MKYLCAPLLSWLAVSVFVDVTTFFGHFMFTFQASKFPVKEAFHSCTAEV